MASRYGLIVTCARKRRCRGNWTLKLGASSKTGSPKTGAFALRFGQRSTCLAVREYRVQVLKHLAPGCRQSQVLVCRTFLFVGLGKPRLQGFLNARVANRLASSRSSAKRKPVLMEIECAPSSPAFASWQRTTAAAGCSGDEMDFATD